MIPKESAEDILVEMLEANDYVAAAEFAYKQGVEAVHYALGKAFEAGVLFGMNQELPANDD